MLEDIEGLTVELLQQSLPITVGAEPRFSKSLKPLLRQLEMWINFQALKADWYGDDNFVLSFDFTLVRSLEEKQLSADSWVLETGYAYHYESSQLTTIAFIAIDDLVQDGVGIELAIKARLTAVANAIAVKHGLLVLS